MRLKGIITVLAITFFLFFIVSGIGEIILRAKHPFNENQITNQFNPQYGWVFTPEQTVRITNHADFWVEEKVNSLGFIDRPPPIAKNDDACRVVFLGDSFVEAVQVPINQKIHVQFEIML